MAPEDRNWKKWIESELSRLYPNLDIHFNTKEAIGSELDLYIPELKLAFELNGIVHFQPIYGDGKLKQVRENDACKMAACRKFGITLHSIDTSKQKYFKCASSQIYLETISAIINNCLLIS